MIQSTWREIENLKPDLEAPPCSHRRPKCFYAPADLQANQVVVSIVTPTYNPEAYIFDTAKSVLSQSLQSWEWIIVDDGSDDPESLGRIESIASMDSRIKLVRHAHNMGPSCARNTGIANAKGKYVFFLDDDDLIEPSTLEKLAWFLEARPELAMAKGWSIAFGDQQYYSTAGFEDGNLFLHENRVTVTSMLRHDILELVGGFDCDLKSGLEDWELWLKIAAHGWWGGTLPEFLDWYRRRVDHSDRWGNWTEQGVKSFRNLMKQRYPHIYERGIPVPHARQRLPYEGIATELPFRNPLLKDKPRLLFVIPWMSIGGADKFNLDFVGRWIESGFEITIVTTINKNYAWYREFSKMTPDIFILPNFLPKHEYLRFLDYLVDSRKYDAVLVSNSEVGHRMLPYLRHRYPQLPIIDYSHMEEEYWQSGGHPRRVAAYHGVIDLSIVSSNHLKDWMIKHGADPERVEVVYTGAEAYGFEEKRRLRASVRSKFGISDELPIILYVGRICAQKQPKVFAEVMYNLTHRFGQDFRCLVIGDGEELSWLRQYSKKRKLENKVLIMGALPNQVVREYMLAADIFFLPSTMEGISVAIYEAMAAGLAIVAADVGGQSELVTPECGILVKRTGIFWEEVDLYTSALISLLSDRKRVEAMGRAAMERVSQSFTLSQMIEKMQYLLLERARSLNNLRQSFPVDGKLAVEHFQMGLEIDRLEEHLHYFWVRKELFEKLINLSRKISLLLEIVKLLNSKMIRFKKMKLSKIMKWARAIKDAIWIAGHRVKVALRLTKQK